MSVEPVMSSNHLILCRLFLLPPSIFSSIRVFASESVLHIRWPKYWSFSVSISPSNEYSGLISFRMDWLDLLVVHQEHLISDFLYDGLAGSPFRSRNSQESFPTPQFKSISSSVLSFLHSPTLTSIHDH